jgi:hypothetical protein
MISSGSNISVRGQADTGFFDIAAINLAARSPISLARWSTLYKGTRRLLL